MGLFKSCVLVLVPDVIVYGGEAAHAGEDVPLTQLVTGAAVAVGVDPEAEAAHGQGPDGTLGAVQPFLGVDRVEGGVLDHDGAVGVRLAVDEDLVVYGKYYS